MNADLESILVNDLKVPADRLRPEASVEEAGFDSLTIVELSMLLRERLNVNISDVEIKGAATVGKLDRLVERRRRNG